MKVAIASRLSQNNIKNNSEKHPNYRQEKANMQEKLKAIDIQIQKLQQKKSDALEKNNQAILKTLNKLKLNQWETKTIKNALTFLQIQKNQNSEIYKEWQK